MRYKLTLEDYTILVTGLSAFVLYLLLNFLLF